MESGIAFILCAVMLFFLLRRWLCKPGLSSTEVNRRGDLIVGLLIVEVILAVAFCLASVALGLRTSPSILLFFRDGLIGASTGTLAVVLAGSPPGRPVSKE